MGLADLVDISRLSAGAVAVLGLVLTVAVTVVGLGIAWLWRRFVDARRTG